MHTDRKSTKEEEGDEEDEEDGSGLINKLLLARFIVLKQVCIHNRISPIRWAV